MQVSHDGSPAVLSVSASTARRQIALHVQPVSDKHGVVHYADLHFRLMPSVQGSGPEAHGRPWLKARLFQASDGKLVSEGLWVLGDPGVEGYLNGVSLSGCSEQARCDAAYVLEFERQGPPTDGEVLVKWTASSWVNWTSPDSGTYTLSLDEE
ncbi:hypothetical protein DAT35_45905 [Vitiosangium sp. GDMCC 1.1324]|nr:hypothetical protein DAT35_45905 [Vitiosangium sp. GDMCC 1.1324]